MSQVFVVASLWVEKGLYEKFVQVTATNPYAQKAHALLRQAEALLAYGMSHRAIGR